MFESVDGLPTHALVVHAVVVLLPVAALGAIAIAVVPRWRRPYGPLVLAAALVSTALVPVATQSGDELAEHVGRPAEHAERGEQLIWFAVPLLLLVLALVLLDRRPRPDARLLNVVAGLCVLAAIAAGVQIYRVGEAGAHAVWDGTLDQHVSGGD